MTVDHRGELRPSWHRLDKLCELLTKTLAQPTVSRDEIRSLAGVMTWQVLFLRGSAAFSRSLWDLVNWPGELRCVRWQRTAGGTSAERWCGEQSEMGILDEPEREGARAPTVERTGE